VTRLGRIGADLLVLSVMIRARPRLLRSIGAFFGANTDRRPVYTQLKNDLGASKAFPNGEQKYSTIHFASASSPGASLSALEQQLTFARIAGE
jgi:hypothetical protein